MRMCFFFQAEDGIRDLTVTGVQTCALPIYPHVKYGNARRGYVRVEVTPKRLLADIRSMESVKTRRSEEHTSELQSQSNLVCRLLLEKKKDNYSRRSRSQPVSARLWARSSQH